MLSSHLIRVAHHIEVIIEGVIVIKLTSIIDIPIVVIVIIVVIVVIVVDVF